MDQDKTGAVCLRAYSCCHARDGTWSALYAERMKKLVRLIITPKECKADFGYAVKNEHR